MRTQCTGSQRWGAGPLGFSTSLGPSSGRFRTRPSAVYTRPYRIEHHDALVGVPIGNVDLVGRRIDGHGRWLPEKGFVVAAVGLPELADLQEELPLRSELERHVAIAGHPHVALVIDEHAVFGPGLTLHPAVAGARSTPGLDDIALGIELDDRRRQPLGLPWQPARAWPGFSDSWNAEPTGDPACPRQCPMLRRGPSCWEAASATTDRARRSGSGSTAGRCRALPGMIARTPSTITIPSPTCRWLMAMHMRSPHWLVIESRHRR